MRPRVERAVRLGDVYYADLRLVVDSEQGGVRPVLILPNDVGNRHSPTVIAAPITSRQTKARLPTHVAVGVSIPRLYQNSIVLLEQLRTLDKGRLREQIGVMAAAGMQKIDQALGISVGLAPVFLWNFRSPLHFESSSTTINIGSRCIP